MARWFAVLASALLAACAGNAFAQAAYVHEMTGSATATVGALKRALKVGDLVESGSVVGTGEKSSAVIKFEDGQVMVLAERSSFHIVDYKYNKERVSQSSAVFSLLQGGLRFISGVIGSTNHNNFRLSAGSTTIGIRGSDGTARYDSVTQAVLVAVLAGALSLNTAQGAQLIGVGNFSTAVAGQQPTIPQLTAQATSAVQQAVNALAVQIVPSTSPVVVTASAAAAAAVANAVSLANQAKAQPGNTVLQAAAEAASKVAQDSLAAAIQAGQDAYQAAIKAGAVPAAPPAPPPTLLQLQLPQGATGTVANPSITIDGVTVTPTGGAGSGGGGTSTGIASPN